MIIYKCSTKATLTDILIALKAWKADQGRLGHTDEELFEEVIDRLEFLQERQGM